NFRRAEDQEASFESGDGIAPEVRSHAAPAVEVDLRDPSVAMLLADVLSIVSDPALVGDRERPVLFPTLGGFLPPAVDPLACLVEVGREPPDPAIPVERALNRSVIECADPNRRPRLLIRLRCQPGFVELEELAFEGKALLRPKTVNDA